MSDPASSATGENPRQRLVLLLAVAAAAVVAALVGYFLVLPMVGSDGGTPVAAAPSASVTATPSAPATPSPAATKLQSYGGTIGRDPFKPLLVGSSTSSGTSSGSSAAAEGTTAVPVAPAAPATFQVIDIEHEGGSVVTARVGTAIHIAGVGETIADVVKVVSLKGRCGVFLYGDESFRLCTGDPVKKLG
jgi:hypothetical protein